MRDERARVRLHRQPRARIGVADAPAHLDPGAGLRVAAVMPQPHLQRRRQHRALAERERARGLQHHAQPARIGPRVRLVRLPINLDDLLYCRGVESERVEFKASWDPDRTGPQVLRTICAFANDQQN